MLKVNVDEVPWDEYNSPNGKFRGKYKQISLALGAAKDRNQFNGGHPFDFAIERLEPGATLCPYHDHATQWELFYVLSGTGSVRSNGELHHVTSGDVIIHPPGDAHQIVNDGSVDLMYILIADNPPLDVCRYPDSNKIGIFDDHGRRDLLRAAEVDYFDGEE